MTIERLSSYRSSSIVELVLDHPDRQSWFEGAKTTTKDTNSRVTDLQEGECSVVE